MIKILHTGDLHLGSFPGPEKDGENLRFIDICNCLDAMLAEAREQQPDIAVIAGDIFHQARVWSDRGLKEQQTAVKFLRELSTICPVLVMRGTPNHDSEAQFSTLKTTFEGEDSRVRIVTEPSVSYIEGRNGQFFAVACVPGFDRGYYRAAHPGLSSEEENEVFTRAIENLIIGLKAQCTPGLPSVLVSHFTITGANMESGQTAFFGQFEPVVYPSTLAAADFDLVCFGHIHRPQQLEGCKNTYYCGAVSQLNFNDEGQERGFYIHELEDNIDPDFPLPGDDKIREWDVVKSTFHPLPTRQHLTIRLNDEDIGEITSAGTWLFTEPLIKYQEAAKDKIVRVLYDCTDEHNKAFNHRTLEGWLMEVAGAFYVSEITPQKITITVDRRSMEADGTPESNLTDYLTEKGVEPERIGELVELAPPIISEATEKATQQRRTGLFVPQEIEVHNYRNYRDETFNFDPIRFCTINGSNGAGKSTMFMDAMLDALYEQPREGDLTGWICNDPEARSGIIKFTFRLGEATYRITRTRMKSGKATLNISELVDGQWEDRSKEKFRDTQQEIENIIGMDSLTLKACALIMQDQYGLFLQADKEARMTILGNILGLGIYAGMEELASDRATDTNRAIRTLADKADTVTAGLPDLEQLRIKIQLTENSRDAYLNEAQEKEKALEQLKVKLNTQLEAAGRILRLNGKITTLTGQKATKEAAKTSQIGIIAAADTVLAQEAEITTGVTFYNSLLEREKELIKGKAAYDSIAAAQKQAAADLAANIKNAEEACAKRNTIASKVEQLRKDLDRTGELLTAHAEYEDITARIATLESIAPEYETRKKAVTAAEMEMNSVESDYHLKIAQLQVRIKGISDKVALLENSGCPDAERASCRFLADALKAKEILPAAREKEAALLREYEQAAQNASESLSKARQALADCLYSPEAIDALRTEQRGHMAAEREYQALAAKRSELKAYEERLAELDKAVEQAKQGAKRVRAALQDIEAKLASAKADSDEYDWLQMQIALARQWPEKEKQLPVAREQKTAASGRVLELGTEIEDIEKDIAEARSELAEEQSKTVGKEALQAQVSAKQVEIDSLNRQAQQAVMELGGLKKQVEDVEARFAEARQYQSQMNAMAGNAAGYEELKKAFSQDGIPHNIIRSIIPTFEATATNILGQMSGGRMSVEFVTEKTLKSNSKKEVTTLDIIINDSSTGRLPYMSRSGGERVKAALSVILALSEIKSSKAGVQLGFLAIDEPPFLDAEGTQAYCTALETIQTRYPDTKVLAISHDETFKARFPQSVTVYKDETGSHVRAD